MRFVLSLTFAALALGVLGSVYARGGDGAGGCPQCGCCNVTKVCKIVPVTIQVPKTCYACKCGDTCVPGKSTCVGTECVKDCDGHTCQQKVYEPCCGKVYKTVTPEKTTTMIQKNSYKCVVEYICDKCGCCCGSEQAPGYSARSYSPPGSVTPGQTVPQQDPHAVHRQSN
jgi:hypothetical protein